MVKKNNDVKVPQIEVEVKEENLTSSGVAGVLFNTAMREFGLAKYLKDITIKKRLRGYSDLCYQTSLISNFFYGNFGLNSLDMLERDENFRAIIGLTHVPDPCSVGEYLRRFTKNDVDELNKAAIEILKYIINSLDKKTYTYGTWIYGFIDGSLLEVSGNQREGIETKDRNGNKSLLFMPFYLDDFLANVTLAGGNEHESKFVSELLKPYEKFLKKHNVHIFLDSAFYSHKIVETDLKKAGCRFSMTVNKSEGPLESLAEQIDAKNWKKADNKKYFGGVYEKIEMSEISYRPEGWESEQRYCVARCKKPMDMIYYYHFVLTDRRKLTPEEVFDLHLIKGGEENKHKNLLCDMNLHHPPMQKMLGNKAYYTFAMIAHNLLHGVKKLHLPAKEFCASRTRTLFQKVMRIPAIVTSHANKVIVRIEKCVLTPELLNLFSRFKEWYPLLR